MEQEEFRATMSDKTAELLRELFPGRSGLADAVAIFAVFINDHGQAVLDVAVSPPERAAALFVGVESFLHDLKRAGGDD